MADEFLMATNRERDVESERIRSTVTYAIVAIGCITLGLVVWNVSSDIFAKSDHSTGSSPGKLAFWQERFGTAPHTHVTDLTDTLAADQCAALDGKLAALDSDKDVQIAVLIVPTTGPETIEQYAARALGDAKLGRQNHGESVLILVARNDHTLRIEVGDGLQDVITDPIAHRIIEETMVPRFRAGDFYGGLDSGVTQLIGLIRN